MLLIWFAKQSMPVSGQLGIPLYWSASVPGAGLPHWNGLRSCGKPNPHFSLFLAAAALSLPSEMPSSLSLMLKPWASPGDCRALELPAGSWGGGGSDQGAGDLLALLGHCLHWSSGEFPRYSPLPGLHWKCSIQEITTVKLVVFMLPLGDSSPLGWLQSDLQQPWRCPNG